MTHTSAPVETQRTTVTNRKIYVRPEHEPAWQQAVIHAQRTGTSLSEVVSLALREKFEVADTADTNA